MASVGANAVLKVTMDSKDFDQGMHRAQKRTKDFENQTKKAQGQLRLMRGGLGQLGHQVQDVAVQLQAGQNAMLVFGQQGSQIASLMGPNGALIGAVLAVGAAIATALLPTLFGMGEGMKEAEEHVDDLIDKFDELSGASRDLALLQAKQKIDGLKESINLTQKELDAGRKTYTSAKDGITIVTESAEDWEERSLTLTETLKNLKQQIVDTEASVDDTTTVFEKMRDRLVEQHLQLTLGAHLFEVYKIRTSGATLEEQNLLIALLDTNKALVESNRLTDDNGDAKAKKAAQLKSILKGLKEEADAIKKSQQERERAKAKEEAAAVAQQARFESIRGGYALQAAAVGKTADQIALLKLRYQELKPEQVEEIQRLQALKEANEQAFVQQGMDMSFGDAFTDIKDNFDSLGTDVQIALGGLAMSAISTVGGAMEQVSQLFEEGSGKAKAFMLVSKALAAGNAIIAGLVGEMQINQAYASLAAATANPALIKIGHAHGALMKTMGFVNAGMIMGQALASFEGGGFTGNGARAGGIDSKGGFLSILHPNETVIDHTKGQSMATNVTINIQANDTKGFDELLRSRRGEIVSIVNKAINNRGVSSLI
jgi:hypothetical protein